MANITLPSKSPNLHTHTKSKVNDKGIEENEDLTRQVESDSDEEINLPQVAISQSIPPKEIPKAALYSLMKP
jgi:hypothetical protein